MTIAIPVISWTEDVPRIPDSVARWIWNESGKQRRVTERADGQPIPEGGRNNALASLAGSMRRRGMSESAITAALREVNNEQCNPPLDDGDVRRIAQSVCRYEANDPVVRLFEKGQRDPVYDEEGHLEHRFQVSTLREIADTPSPGYEQLLGPYIIKGLRTLIGAGTGEGKTTLLMWMLRAVVTGEGFLGEKGVGEVEGRRPTVLIIDAEQSLPDVQRLADETGLGESEDIHYIMVPDGMHLGEGTHDAAEVEEILDEIKPDILVIDPAYKIASIDSNNEREVVDLMRLLDRWRAAHGFALVMPVHTRKGLKQQQGGQPSMDDIFGSGAFSRGAEIILGLRRPGPGFARMYVWKHRPGMVDAGTHVDAKFDRDSGFTRMDRDDGKSLSQMIVSLLNLHAQGMTLMELSEQMGRTPEAIRHGIRGAAGEIKSDFIDGTHGKKLYKAIAADEGDLARWEAMLTNDAANE